MKDKIKEKKFRKNYQQNIIKYKNRIFVGKLVVRVPPKKVVKLKNETVKDDKGSWRVFITLSIY